MDEGLTYREQMIHDLAYEAGRAYQQAVHEARANEIMGLTPEPPESIVSLYDDGGERQRTSPLEFLTVKELRARVAAAGPRRFLLRGLWPHGDYGVHAGDMKAQKTWTTVDAAVSVASGTPWLGLVPVDLSGPVLMFAGEGGDADLLRRIDAVAAARGQTADDLEITVCCRAPHLSDAVHLGLMADQLDRIRPTLTTVDPLYLAARGAKLGDLYAMGAVLEAPQHMCQEAGSSLWIATHQNRREGRGASRITGAGPAEWGRVLISATVISRHLDAATKETTVITELDVIGGSIPGGQLRVLRRIRADDPADLESPLHYHVAADHAEQDDAAKPEMPPARAKLLGALDSEPVTVATLVDRVSKQHGHGLKRETCSRELNALLQAGLADRLDQGAGRAALWYAIDGRESETRDQPRDQTRESLVRSVDVRDVTAALIGGHVITPLPDWAADAYDREA